jgi:hypothetical protein
MARQWGQTAWDHGGAMMAWVMHIDTCTSITHIDHTHRSRTIQKQPHKGEDTMEKKKLELSKLTLKRLTCNVRTRVRAGAHWLSRGGNMCA